MTNKSQHLVPKLWIDEENAFGETKFPAAWKKLDAFTRLEIMQGWAHAMDAERAKAHDEVYPKNKEKEEAREKLAMRVSEVIDHPLFEVMLSAVEQAMFGKGGRHGGNKTPFLKQPWVHYSNMHGRGFLTGQATKKLEEAASTREGEAFITEVLGAIVYSGMSIIKERGIK